MLSILKTRGIRVSKTARARLLACSDDATLDRWIEQAVTVARAAELFAEPAS